MKLFVLFAVFGFLGTALCDEEGGDLGTQNEDGGASSATTCLNIPENSLGRTTTQRYVDMALQCVSIDPTGMVHDNLTTMEEFRQQARQYCFDVADMRDCLVNMSKVSDTCLNQTRHQIFQIFLDMLESSLEIGCRQDGASLAVFSHGVRSMPPEENIIRKCLELLEYKMSSVGISDQDASAKILWLYHQIDVSKQCFSSPLREEEEEFSGVVVSFMDEFRSRMKCIHPENRSTVLCSTLDNN